MENVSISHILVPVDPNDGLQASHLAALQLASGAGSMITLLYVHDRYVPLKVTSDLDALANLHSVLFAAPEENQAAPVHADPEKRLALKRLQKLRDQLALVSPEEVDIRITFRPGNPRDEIVDFIHETGVDVVMIQSPETCSSKRLRQIAGMLQQSCPCQMHIVHPPHSSRPTLGARILSWWKAWTTPQSEFDRPATSRACSVNER